MFPKIDRFVHLTFLMLAPQGHASCPRMMPPVNFLQLRGDDVCVYLRCSDVGMAEHHLQRAQIGSARQHMRGETVPQ